MPPAPSRAKLWFLGAGPGAADLLTVRAAKVLAQADVVIWGKNLLTDDVVGEYARADAELVPWPPATMADIHAVYDRAKAEDLLVARLMWGDPALFGSVREEARQARDRGLAYEFVPGVSSLAAAAAALEIELTTAPTTGAPLILAAPRDEPPPGQRMDELASHGATMAIFMGASRAATLQEQLLAGGYAPATGCAIVNRVTFPEAVVIRCRLDELAAIVAERGLERHTLILVGPALDRDDQE